MHSLIGRSLLLDCLDLLLFLPKLALEKRLQVGILNRSLRIQLVSKGETSSDDDALLGLHYESQLALSYEFSCLLGHDGVGLNHLVIDALLNADLGANGVLEPADGEGKRGVLLVDNGEESARILAL